MPVPIPAPTPVPLAKSRRSEPNQRSRRSAEEIATEKQAEKQARIDRRMARILRFAATLDPIGGRYYGISEGALLPQIMRATQANHDQQGGIRCPMS